MGVEDSIRKAAENAMEDLAGTSDPVDDQHVPEPGAKDDDIQVHSSISEGSNAMDSESPDQGNPTTPRHNAATSDTAASDSGERQNEPGPDAATGQGMETDDNVQAPSGDVPGPAGLPDGTPDELRADPSEGDQDPSTSMGRG
ncbi:hypothetical protein [Arthrobacter sp. StoSoilB5]|jgi:hypothetical protein|uniref:hypothetical protein n=1 Tax=Arthrobacter sp. StoSoilB5 TaxID=2830992 RepID=UPI001CC815CB|nr:hypothetical protein [Arthrobacter sp. StoSoilB5]BCW43911.1 hypothetical protein StoSoilB5_10950 [Arthrobacter sp. StoSoilB5]